MKYKNQFWRLEHDIEQNTEWHPEQVLYYDLPKKKWVHRKEYSGNLYYISRVPRLNYGSGVGECWI